MSITDYVIDILLIGIVVLQIRERRVTVRSLVLPLAIVAYVAHEYLHGIPTAHNDLLLVGITTAAGALLGGLAAAFTKVRRAAAGPVAKAGVVAAVLWVLGVGSRFAFQLYASHGGGAAIGRFSLTHGITSNEAWTAALVLMALAEVVVRSVVIAARAYPFAGRQAAVSARSDTEIRETVIMDGRGARI